MAIIRSGLLVGLFRSAAGMTFYSRQGTNAVRSKPVRSLDWEPSELQRYFQQVFSSINDFIKSNPIMLSVVEGGWGWSRRNNSSSNLNNIIGYITRSMTRYEGGERRPIAETRTLYQTFLSNPLKYFIEHCQIVASAYPLVGGVEVDTSSASSTTWRIPLSQVDEWRRKVEKIEGRFRAGSDVFFLIAISYPGTTTTPRLIYYKPSLTDGGYIFTGNIGLKDKVIVQLSLAINESSNATTETRTGWAISPVFGSVNELL